MDKIECNTADMDGWAEFWGFTREEYEEFLDMAIKALEAKDVLDKIRSEIEELPTNTRTNWNGCCPDDDYPEIEYVDVSKNHLLAIIDKYKAESEDKE